MYIALNNVLETIQSLGNESEAWILEEDGSSTLRCIDENRCVLTLDFAMKLLILHKRTVCSIPCIIEGEIGVSKSALTKMYTVLWTTISALLR